MTYKYLYHYNNTCTAYLPGRAVCCGVHRYTAGNTPS